MKLSPLLTFCTFLLSLTISAQVDEQLNISLEFGKVSLNDFEYEPSFDEEAPAVVLFDKGYVWFEDTAEGWYQINYTRTKRIKILTNEGLDYAKFSIPFYQDGYGKMEFVKDVEACTYNLTGRLERTELDKKMIYEEQINEWWLSKVFAFPQAKEGSIVEVRYTITSPFLFNPPDWEFQSEIPTVYSKYKFQLIPFYEYVSLMQGSSGLHTQKSYVAPGTERYWRSLEFKDMVHEYAMREIPAFKDESYISSRNDYITKLDLQLSKYYSPINGNTEEILSTWPKLSEDYLKRADFGKFIDKSEKKAKGLLEEELSLSGLSEVDQAKAIVEYVRTSFSWNGYYGKVATQSPADLIKKRSGNDADLNLFLIGMLRAAGIQAEPILISTRNHGKVWTDYPFAKFFNYVIAYVKVADQQPFLSEATEPKLGFNRIPPRCINGRGLLLLEDEEPQWLDLYSSVQARTSVSINQDIDPEKLKSICKVYSTKTEFDAYAEKVRFKDDTIVIKDYLLDHEHTDVSSVATKFYDSNEKPYLIAYESKFPIGTINNKLIVRPLLNYPMAKNNLTQKKRSYPVDFIYSQSENYVSMINLPEGYKVAELPEELSMENDLVKLEYMSSANDTQVRVEATIEFKKAVYQSHEYARMKNYFDKIVKHFNGYLVLEPIN